MCLAMYVARASVVSRYRHWVVVVVGSAIADTNTSANSTPASTNSYVVARVSVVLQHRVWINKAPHW